MQNNGPEISIVTATKNARDDLEKTIQSVAELKNGSIRYILIDGGSTDGTLDLIRENNRQIDVWESGKDSGIYDAYNKGWEIANPDSYVLFLGAGDQILQLPHAELSPEMNRVIYGRVALGDRHVFISRLNKMSRFANTLHHQALLIPKRLHVQPPFNTNYRVYADFDFNQRLIKRDVHFAYSRHFMAYAKPGGVSRDYSSEAFRISSRNFGPFYGFLSILFFLYQKGKAIGNRMTR